MAEWDTEQYLQFLNERTRPAAELLARVSLERAESIVDLGCGPGNSTQLLRTRWPDARIIGVDSSNQMLEQARADCPAGEWVRSDAMAFQPDAVVDVLFSNALLHWIADHDAALPKLLAHVRPGGTFAVQMPHNFSAPSHRLMREVGATLGLPMDAVRPAEPVQSPAHYYDVLAAHARHVDIWQTTYEHVMPDAESIVEWVKGTGIRPYLARLTVAEQSAYLQAYTREIAEAYPARANGKRLFSFSRLFIVAVR